MWCLGFFFETIGDYQLSRFRGDPARRGQVLDTGLWRYTRHPNYFGELCQWWGLFVIALEAPRLLEYSWTLPDQDDSVLRFELAADGQDTHVVLEHRLLPPDQAVGYGAGWHAHLDSLQMLAEGTDPIEWEQRFSEVLGHYAGA